MNPVLPLLAFSIFLTLFLTSQTFAQTNYSSLSDYELVTELKKSFERTDNVSQLFEKASLLDWIFQETKNLNEKIADFEGDSSEKDRLLIKTSSIIDQIKESENLIWSGDILEMETHYSNIQTQILGLIEEFNSGQTFGLSKEDQNTTIKILKIILEGSDKTGINILELEVDEENHIFFGVYNDAFNSAREQNGLISQELTNRNFMIESFIFMTSEIPEFGLIIFGPQLQEIDSQLENSEIQPWVKETAKFWIRDQISNMEYYHALHFYSTKGAIEIPDSYRKILDELVEEDVEVEEELDADYYFKAISVLWLNEKISDKFYSLLVQGLNMDIENHVHQMDINEQYEITKMSISKILVV